MVEVPGSEVIEMTDKRAPLSETTHLQNEAEAETTDKLNKNQDEYLKQFTEPLPEEEVAVQLSKDSYW